jgi:hypothetical protein
MSRATQMQARTILACQKQQKSNCQEQGEKARREEQLLCEAGVPWKRAPRKTMKQQYFEQKCGINAYQDASSVSRLCYSNSGVYKASIRRTMTKAQVEEIMTRCEAEHDRLRKRELALCLERKAGVLRRKQFCAYKHRDVYQIERKACFKKAEVPELKTREEQLSAAERCENLAEKTKQDLIVACLKKEHEFFFQGFDLK